MTIKDAFRGKLEGLPAELYGLELTEKEGSLLVDGALSQLELWLADLKRDKDKKKYWCEKCRGIKPGRDFSRDEIIGLTAGYGEEYRACSCGSGHAG